MESPVTARVVRKKARNRRCRLTASVLPRRSWHTGVLTVLLWVTATTCCFARTPPQPAADGSPPIRPPDEYLLFQPANYVGDNWHPEGLNHEDVWFTSRDGTRLHGWYCTTPEPRAVVLYLHGNAGNLSHRTEVLRRLRQRHQVSVLIFDYRGYGQSEGTPTVRGAIEDAAAARRVLAQRAECGESDIVLMGRSLGGAIAVQIAAQQTPRALIIESAFDSYRHVAESHFPRLAWLIPRQKLNSAALITDIRCPLLQSHGDRDRVVPWVCGRRLFEAAPGPKTFVRIPGGDHNDPQPEDYARALDTFLSRLPAAAPE